MFLERFFVREGVYRRTPRSYRLISLKCMSMRVRNGGHRGGGVLQGSVRGVHLSRVCRVLSDVRRVLSTCLRDFGTCDDWDSCAVVGEGCCRFVRRNRRSGCGDSRESVWLFRDFWSRHEVLQQYDPVPRTFHGIRIAGGSKGASRGPTKEIWWKSAERLAVGSGWRARGWVKCSFLRRLSQMRSFSLSSDLTSVLPVRHNA